MTLNLPSQAHISKKIPKQRFYNHARVRSQVKKEFVDVVEQIVWEYKLSPKTIGIPPSENIEEIEVFIIYLRERKVPKRVLDIIDTSVAYPILYRLQYQDTCAYAISLKQTNQEGWYISTWGEEMSFHFGGRSLKKVYQSIIASFVPTSSEKEIDFATMIARDKQRKTLEKEISALKHKINTEKQFKRKVELNKQLQTKQQILKSLT